MRALTQAGLPVAPSMVSNLAGPSPLTSAIEADLERLVLYAQVVVFRHLQSQVVYSESCTKEGAAELRARNEKTSQQPALVCSCQLQITGELLAAGSFAFVEHP